VEQVLDAVVLTAILQLLVWLWTWIRGKPMKIASGQAMRVQNLHLRPLKDIEGGLKEICCQTPVLLRNVRLNAPFGAGVKRFLSPRKRMNNTTTERRRNNESY
jgi:hypothetical protein